jgi:hypothetical protein
MKKLILIVTLLLLTSCSYDTNSQDIDFTYVLTASGIDLDNYTESLELQPDSEDKNLILARIYSEEYYDFLEDPLTKYSITKNPIHLIKPYSEETSKWKKKIYFNLLIMEQPKLEFQPQEIEFSYLATPNDTKQITFGKSYFFLTPEDHIVSQSDRVTKDFLTQQFGNDILTIFSEGYNIDNIGWHEGARIKELQQINLSLTIAEKTFVAKHNNKWYAPNENGTFMFEVPIDKVSYPTTLFLTENLAIIQHTHGMNMIVEQTINNNATTVIACCDHEGKIAAAQYLANKGVKVICNTDKYLPLLLGKNLPILGSAPFEIQGDQALVGYQPISISFSENIIVLNATENYGLSYYSTPTIYFTTLQKKTMLPLNLTFVTIDDYNQLYKLTEEEGKVIAARVYNENDYTTLTRWLDQDEKHRLILFHSEPYPYGYKILREYPQQVTFDDIKPRFT